MRPNARYLSLDVWRGLACLMVVVDHVGLILSPTETDAPGLEGVLRRIAVGSVRLALGPSMFFVISGYCIAASLESAMRQGKSSFDFLRRRLTRTLPPYWVALGIFAAIPVYLNTLGLERFAESPYGIRLLAPDSLSAWQWLGNLTLTEEFRPRFAGPETMRLIPVTWTLGLQEQFYLVSFALATLGPRRFRAALAAGTATILLFHATAVDVGLAHRLRGLFPEYWHEFAVGLGVYWRLNTTAPRVRRRLFDAGLLMLAAAQVLGRGSAGVAAGFGLVLIGLRRFDARLADASLLTWIRSCGRRCYSIYLIHIPFLVVGTRVTYELGWESFGARLFLVLPTVSAFCVAGGFVFHALVESRFIEPRNAGTLSPRCRRGLWPFPSGRPLPGCT